MTEISKKEELENTKALTEAAQEVEDCIDNDKYNVLVSKQKVKQDVINPFVILFADSLYELLHNNSIKITITDLKVLMLIIRTAQYGNLVSINQSYIAGELNTSQTAISRSMKNLKIAGLIIEDRMGIFLNPQIISKGALSKIEDDKYEAGIKAMLDRGLEPNFKKKAIVKKTKT